MFVIALFFNFLGPLLLGIVLDTYGPRICSIVSICCIAAGCILFALSNVENSPYFIPAMCLIAFGGPGAQNAIIHLSNLFPTWKATATALITGSFQLSFFVFFIFDYLWLSSKWDYQGLFFGYSFVCLINIIVSLFLWPDKPYSFEEQFTTIPDVAINSNIETGVNVDSNKNRRNHYVETDADDNVPIGPIRLPSAFIKIDQLVKNNSSIQQDTTSKKGKQHTIMSATSKPIILESRSSNLVLPLKDRNMTQQIRSSTYIFLCVFFVVNSFWANFYVGTIDLQLGDSHLYSSAEQKAYGSIFTAIMTFGFIAIPIVGALMDKVGFPATSFVTSLLGVIWALLLVIRKVDSII